MVSGRSGGPPAAACTLEFDTDLFDGDMKTADGELAWGVCRLIDPSICPLGRGLTSHQFNRGASGVL